MARKPKLSPLSDRDEEALSKLSRKERVQATGGKPDRTDIAGMIALFETYDRVTGGKLKRFVQEIDVENKLNNKKFPDAMTAENLSFQLPKDLQEEMELYWPSLWTNPEHLRWFLKNFPMFRR